eukprot:364364-Chlamydomonas_euryale.AAC.6
MKAAGPPWSVPLGGALSLSRCRALHTLDVPLHTSYRTGQTMGLWDRPRGRRDRTQIYRAGSPAGPAALSGIISVTCGTA